MGSRSEASLGQPKVWTIPWGRNVVKKTMSLDVVMNWLPSGKLALDGKIHYKW